MDNDDMTRIDELAGQVGATMADQLAQKVIEVVEGFPGSNAAQRSAIAQLVSREIDGYAGEQADKARLEDG
jgi:predicted dinucleotide-binding enzyme